MGEAVTVTALALLVVGLGCSVDGACREPAPGMDALVPGLDDLLHQAERTLGAELGALLRSDQRAGETRLFDVMLPGPGEALHARAAVDQGSPAAHREAAPPPTNATHMVSTHPAPAPPGPAASAVHVHGAWPATEQGSALPVTPTQQAAGVALALAAIGLYHRLDRARLLAHPARQRLLTELRERPGLTTREVANVLDVVYRTARHHLEKLEAHDLIVRKDHGSCIRWYLPGDARQARQQLDPVQQALVTLLDEEPGLHLSAVADRLDVAKATAKLQLDRLVAGEVLVEERVGPLRRFYLAER